MMCSRYSCDTQSKSSSRQFRICHPMMTGSDLAFDLLRYGPSNKGDSNVGMVVMDLRLAGNHIVYRMCQSNR